MNRRSILNLIGAARLTDEPQSIGFAIFGAKDSNRIFVAETDYDLRISKFLDYYNEEGFFIDYSLPSSHRNKSYSIGEPGPMPFWLEGTINVIDGDADSDAPQHLFGSYVDGFSSVIGDLSRILGNARSGFYREREGVWKANEISAQFGDVIDAPPVHSRYWVSRYRVAVATARDLTQPPHPIDHKLRSSARKWLQRFGAKTDFSRLQAVCGIAEDSIFGKDEIAHIMFGYLTHKVASGDYSDGESDTKRIAILEIFPDGLYGYWLTNGWVRTFFPYNKPDDFRSVIKSAIYKAHKTGNFKRAHTLSIILFADRAVPKDVFETAEPILRERSLDFRERKEYAFKETFKFRGMAQHWQSTALSLQDDYMRLIYLDAILHGNGRLDLRPVEGRFGMHKSDIAELRRYAGQLKLR